MANFSPTREEICIVRGDTPVIPVTVQDSAGTAIDISAGTFTLTVDVSDSPADASGNLFTLTGTVTDGPNGIVTFQPTTTQSNQTPGEYFYDVQMDLAGSVRTILKGDFVIEQDITK